MTISAQPQRPMRRRDRELSREEALRAARAAGHAVLSFIHPDTGKEMDFRLPVPGTWPAWGIRQETTMEQQYKTDSEIYAVLEREIIDLTLRPGCR